MPKNGMLIRISLALVAAAAIAVSAGVAAGTGSAARTSGVTINGAGSSLVGPAVAIWAKNWDAKTKNTVNYSSVGSGTGEKDIDTRLVNFGASDAPLSIYHGTANPCSGCVQIPWGLSGTVPVANIGLKNGKLHLTGKVLADIYLGYIKKWNDPKIKAINSGVKLPNESISVVYRSDGSGDTYVFTHYLSDVSSTWKSKVGYSTTVNWPTGTGAPKNAGVAAAVQNTPGAIGYVGAAYVVQDKLSSAAVQNNSKKYVTVSLSAIAQAAKSVTKIPSSNEISLVNPPQNTKYAGAWPLATYTYVFLHKNGDINTVGTNTTKTFISWVVQHGENSAPIAALYFAPLPSFVVNADLKTLAQVKHS